MGLFSKLFSSRQPEEPLSLGVTTEIHSHLLPGLDDGVETFEEAIEIVKLFRDLGIKKIITTPHIMSDAYRNTPEKIRAKRDELRALLKAQQIDVQLDAAAEYYLDEGFVAKINNKEELLTFGDRYILFETSYLNESSFFSEVVFKLITEGYKPVLAHPERYVYLNHNFEDVQEMYNAGVCFQININSISGYYSSSSKELVEKLIDRSMVEFIGSDCHGMRHMVALKKAMQSKYYKKLLSLQLLNNTL